jgi:hypothetical protein
MKNAFIFLMCSEIYLTRAALEAKNKKKIRKSDSDFSWKMTEARTSIGYMFSINKVIL